MFWYVFEGETDWKRVYMAAAGWTEEDAEADPVHLGQYLSKWKGTNKFKVELQRLKLAKENYLKDIQQRAYEEGRRSAFKESAAGTKEEIEKQGLTLLGVLPQSEEIYRCDCEGAPSAKLPATNPVKQALAQILSQLSL